MRMMIRRLNGRLVHRRGGEWVRHALSRTGAKNVRLPSVASTTVSRKHGEVYGPPYHGKELQRSVSSEHSELSSVMRDHS